MPAEAVLKNRTADPRLPERRSSARRRLARHPARAVRPAGPERRGQIDADAHRRHAAGADLGPDHASTTSTCWRDPTGAAPPARLPAAGFRRLSAGLGLEMLDHMAVLKGVSRRQGAQGRRRAPAEPDQSLGRAQEGAGRLLRRHAPALRHRPGADRRPVADHRRRADRGPRPGGALPLPQPAGRDRRERRGDPLDPHRRGRLRPLPAHGDHRRRPHRARGRAGRR